MVRSTLGYSFACRDGSGSETINISSWVRHALGVHENFLNDEVLVVKALLG